MTKKEASRNYLGDSVMEIGSELRTQLEPFLPQQSNEKRPHVTLTYAQSLDAKIAAQRGQRTAISHQETKNMTHYLRSRHAAILVGVSTVLIDNPSLANKYDSHKIKPVVVDPHFKMMDFYPTSQLLKNYQTGVGARPTIVISRERYTVEATDIDNFAEKYPCHIEVVDGVNSRFEWKEVLCSLDKAGIDSVMIEGGAQVINDLLLEPGLVDSLIVTIGPVYLGKDGLPVEPNSTVQLIEVGWWKGQYDTVMMGKLAK